VQLGQLPQHRCLTLSERVSEFSQRLGDTARRFEEDEGETRGGGASKQPTALTMGARKEPEERHRTVDEPGGRDRGGEGRRSGDGRDRMAGREGGGDERLSRIGDAGCPGVADEGDVARGERIQEKVAAGALVEGVVADQGRLDAEVRQQAPGVPGILGGDRGHITEDAECAGGDVLEVADRRGDDVEGAHS